MPFALTPASGQAIRPPEQVDVAAIDFIVDTDVWNVTRGVGENSHVATLRITGGPAIAESPWNSGNEAPADSWAFAESDYLATMVIETAPLP